MAMRIKIGNSLLIATVSLLLNAMSALAGNCNELETSTSRELINYLKSDRNVPECVESAIDRLEALKDPDAIEALIKHLDFVRAREHADIVLSSSHYSESPAVDALFSIGKPALPALERVLQEALTDRLSFRNAVLAFTAINRENTKEIVLFFEHAYFTAQDQSVRNRILHAYKDQARLCRELHETECTAIVNPSLTGLPDPLVR